MRFCRLKRLTFLALAWCLPALIRAQPGSPDPSTVRDRLQTSVGRIPWSPSSGYQCSGRFVLKALPEEIQYRALIARSGGRRWADFSAGNHTWDVRYGAEGERAWAASPETTVQIEASRLPFPVQFDFPTLFAELVGMLDGARNVPSFQLKQEGREIYVTGQLSGGEIAAFFFNSVEYFPRRVNIRRSSPEFNAWLFATLAPGAVASSVQVAEPSADCELWFSDWAEMGGYRFPARTDYVQRGEVVASFILENGPILSEPPAWNPPEQMSWLRSLAYQPMAQNRPRLFPGESDLASLRSRLGDPPWSDWNRVNRLAAAWALVVRWAGPGFRHPPSPGQIFTGLGIVLLVYAILIVRRVRRYGGHAPWLALAAIVAAGFTVFIVSLASREFHSAERRALLGLHTSLRHVITGDSASISRARRFLSNLSEEAPPDSLEELAKACQAHALAYGFIRGNLEASQNTEVEKTLFEYARPLYGALQGWRSNTAEGMIAAAGLGMTGLAINCEPFVAAACGTIERSLAGHAAGGLHRDAPGRDAEAFNAVVNLFYALKKSGRADFFRNPSFQQYVRTNLQLTSPLGTLPLFGDTGLDDAEQWSSFLLKVAGQMPEETGRECVSAANRYWGLGRYSATGVRKLILDRLQPCRSLFFDPYVMLLYEKTLPAGDPFSASSVLGNGQVAVLRSGSAPDSLYLALNAAGWDWPSARRDILSFDLYAYGALMLHGAGFPGRKSPLYETSARTSSANTMVLAGRSQPGTSCTGITASLINQPLFDYVRAVADRTYDFGEVQRDVVMVRPEEGRAGYFLLVDQVLTTTPRIGVEWYLHGRGEVATGVDRMSRWRSYAFYPPRWRRSEVTLAAFPIGTFDTLRSLPGKLYSRNSLHDGRSEALSLQWLGSRRFCTILFPGRPGIPEPATSILQTGNAVAIGDSDCVSLGDTEAGRSAGRLKHSSEYVVLREREEGFPAVLMISGTDLHWGMHAIVSSKPVTVSLDGLRGGIVTTLPDTRIEIRSPVIRAGEQYLLDGDPVGTTENGILFLLLSRTGTHELRKPSEPRT